MRKHIYLVYLCILAVIFAGCTAAPDSELLGGSSSASVPSTPTSGSVPVFGLASTPNDAVDQNNSQGNDDPADPPGTLQDPSVFRKPDQTDVGKTV